MRASSFSGKEYGRVGHGHDEKNNSRKSVIAVGTLINSVTPAKAGAQTFSNQHYVKSLGPGFRRDDRNGGLLN